MSSAATRRYAFGTNAVAAGVALALMETLADYGDHRFRLLYRDADGVPEQHDAITVTQAQHSDVLGNLGRQREGRVRRDGL